MTQEQITRDAIAQVQNYAQDNGWFKFEGGDPAQPMTPAQFAFAAGKAYAWVKQPAGDTLILGDTKLRSDPEFVRNFGLSQPDSANDRRCFDLAQSLAPAQPPSASPASSATAAARSTPASTMPPMPGTLAATPRPGAAPTAGTGSILNDPYWSPLLNDAFILAGLHNNYPFGFGLVGDEIQAFNSIAVGAAPPGTAPKAQQTAAGMIRWKTFFLAKPQTLWDKGRKVPRVFARELIGLARFGYKAVPVANQLSFEVDDMGKADTATFDLYLQELRRLDFHLQDKKKIMSVISQFLFGGPDELNAI
jgi:hypothetical protein